MLRYSRERHVHLLKERLATLSAANGTGAAPATTIPSTVDPDRREEWMRRLMVGGLGDLRRRLNEASRGLVETLHAYSVACDPKDLRQMDVLHSAYEALRGLYPQRESFVSLWREYAELLKQHVSLLGQDHVQTYRAGTGEQTRIEPYKGALRMLILADNFVSGSRIWRECDDRTAAARPQLLFCNNSRRPPALYHLRLLASLGSLLLRGEWALGLSMVRGRPRVSSRPLGHPSNTAWLQSQGCELGLHNMGIIYRQETIDAFRLGILNAHIGFLPGMRGRSVLEWSLVYGVEPCVSTFFIDQGIDTGAVIVDRYLPPPETVHAAVSVEAAKRQLFQMDGFCYRRAIATLQRGGDGILNRPVGVRFYVMSELLAAAIARS